MLTLMLSLSAFAGPHLDRYKSTYLHQIGYEFYVDDGEIKSIHVDPPPDEQVLRVVIVPYLSEEDIERLTRVYLYELPLWMDMPDPRELDTIDGILRLRDEIAVVTVADEAGALTWLTANSASLERSDQFSVVFVHERLLAR